MLRSARGFTTVEILTVLVLTAIGMVFLNSVFLSNWAAYEDRIERANLLKINYVPKVPAYNDGTLGFRRQGNMQRVRFPLRPNNPRRQICLLKLNGFIRNV